MDDSSKASFAPEDRKACLNRILKKASSLCSASASYKKETWIDWAWNRPHAIWLTLQVLSLPQMPTYAQIQHMRPLKAHCPAASSQMTQVMPAFPAQLEKLNPNWIISPLKLWGKQPQLPFATRDSVGISLVFPPFCSIDFLGSRSKLH